MGENGFWQKSNLHEEVLRVPLIIRAPGYQPGRSKSIVELVDLFPTLADLTGLPIPESLDGVSLRPILDDNTVQVKPGALSFNRGTSLRTPDWHLMSYDDGTQELYDMKQDPNQFTNLAADPNFNGELGRLETLLERRLMDVPDAKKR